MRDYIIVSDKNEKLQELEELCRMVSGFIKTLSSQLYALSYMKGVSIQLKAVATEFSNWMMGVRVHNSPGYNYVQEFFSDNGIETRPMFYAMSKHLYFDGHINGTHNDKIATSIADESFMIPSYPEMTEEQVDYVLSMIGQYRDWICQTKSR